MDTKNLVEHYKEFIGKEVTLEGWIKNHRKQKDFGFIDFTDGTCFDTIQIVYEKQIDNFEEVQKYFVGSAIKIVGVVSKSNGNQDFEIKAKEIILEGASTEDYPIQPKRHTREFLREQAYLRPRTSLFNAVFRVRSVAAYAIHKYFQERNYVYVNTPLITTADCEGENQMFKVTTFDFNHIPMKDGCADMLKDLFGKQAYITGSGQLHGEAFAMAYKKI